MFLRQTGTPSCKNTHPHVHTYCRNTSVSMQVFFHVHVIIHFVNCHFPLYLHNSYKPRSVNASMCFLKDMLSHLFKLLYMLHHGAAEHSEKALNPLSAYLSSMTTIAWRCSDWQVRIPLPSLLSEPGDLSHVICCPAVRVLWTSISSDLCVLSTVVVIVIPVHHWFLFFDSFPHLSLNSLLMKNKW